MIPLKLCRLSKFERFPIFRCFYPNRQSKLNDIRKIVSQVTETLQNNYLLVGKYRQLFGGKQQ